MPENPLLSGADKDVPPDPSTGNNPQSTGDDDRKAANPNPDEGNNSGDPGGKEGKGGRTLDEVTGEFNRKFGRIEGMIESLSSRLSAPPAQPSTDINNMSAEQLEALSSSVSEEQKPALDKLIQERRASELVKSVVGNELDVRNFKSTQQAARTDAFNRFPELYNHSGRFRGETNKILNEMGDAANKNPYALVHAAEAAAQRLGIKHRRQSPFRGEPARGNTAPAGASEEESMVSEDRASELAERFKHAMPGGKFSKERVESARKSSALYNKHKDKFVR